MHTGLKRLVCGIAAVAWLGLAPLAGAADEPVTLQQTISREHPIFTASAARLTVGRDGKAYLADRAHDAAWVLRYTLDGSEKHGSRVVYAVANATANADGVIATANSHFNHAVNLYTPSFERFAAVRDFLVNDRVQWDSPEWVEAGQSGDFYGAGENRRRVVRLDAAGNMKTTYPLPAPPEDENARDPFENLVSMRVHEQAQTFVWELYRHDDLVATDFEGNVLWSYRYRDLGGYDIDDRGRVYLAPQHAGPITRLNLEGEKIDEFTLDFGELAPSAAHPLGQLRVHGNRIVIKRRHPSELFQVYDLETGKRLHVQHTEHERLTVTLGSDRWIAGQRVDFNIAFDSGDRRIEPKWRVWLRPIGDTSFRELAVTDGALTVPDDLAGLYAIKVTPELQPLTRHQQSEYRVHKLIEVRQPNTAGTANVLTDQNRRRFARGEPIRVRLIVRAEEANRPGELTLRLVGGGTTVAQRLVTLEQVAGKGRGPDPYQGGWMIGGEVTRGLQAGRYRVTADAPGLTVIDQPIDLGFAQARPPEPGSDFFISSYGDFQATFPTSPHWWDSDTGAALHLRRVEKMNPNLFVDRLGINRFWQPLTANHRGAPDLSFFRNDPTGVAPEKADLLSAGIQSVAGYGAQGRHQMAILLTMDAGLPRGTGFDKRSDEEFARAIRKVTTGLMPYTAFRGWAWNANWWVHHGRKEAGRRAGIDPSTVAEAFANLRETGRWNDVVQRITDEMLSYPVEASRFFNSVLEEAAPRRDFVTALSGPYRRTNVYPPSDFRRVDEVDLHFQNEQLAAPLNYPHNVDYQSRPGKPAWSHPEWYNEPGTGEQLLPATFLQLMRSVDGVGLGGDGDLPPWGDFGISPKNARVGTLSIWRGLSDIARAYGPWLSQLQPRDPIAIPVSERMVRIDGWGGGSVGGRHFDRYYEAYLACLFAGRPASFVYTEDLDVTPLTDFEAVLVVGQTIEMKPQLREAIDAAAARGVRVLADGTCRDELVSGYERLPLAFNQVSGKATNSDDAHFRYYDIFQNHAEALDAFFGEKLSPVFDVDRSGVLITRSASGNGEVLFTVNDTASPLGHEHLWRISLAISTTIPVTTRVTFDDLAGRPVYDVLAMRRVDVAAGNQWRADLRALPARIYAVLPEPIAGVEIRNDAEWSPGEQVQITITVRGESGEPLRTTIPLRVQWIDAEGQVLQTRHVTGDETGRIERFHVPTNAETRGMRVRVTELFSGTSAQLTVAADGSAAIDTSDTPGGTPPWIDRFGPRVRNFAVIDNGRTAVFGTMDWDENLYALDIKTGEQQWRQRVGHHFATNPQPFGNGFRVEGFDVNAAEGHFVQVGRTNGQAERRFAWFGLPERSFQSAVKPSPPRTPDHQFAAPPGGEWMAASGDLGLAVWSSRGELLWKRAWWPDGTRKTPLLIAMNASTLVVADGSSLRAHEAVSGEQRWSLDFPQDASIQDIAASADGSTLAIEVTEGNGRLYLIEQRNGVGEIVANLPTSAHHFVLSPSGDAVAVTSRDQLKFYDAERGLRWVYTADEVISRPSFDRTGERIALTAQLGSVVVLNREGAVELERDLKALARPAWLDNGDLLLATWAGDVMRLDSDFETLWRTRLERSESQSDFEGRPEIASPLVRVEDWGNAQPHARGLPDNVLSGRNTRVRFVVGDREKKWRHDTAALFDGEPAPPPSPWIAWHYGFWQEKDTKVIEFDRFNTRVRAVGITLVEDEDHPTSWLRDATVQAWDNERRAWVDVMRILSNQPRHTHRFPEPATSSRFRLVLPYTLHGSGWTPRFGEIILHGEPLGSSHPDAANEKPVALLFDEDEASVKGLRRKGRQWNFNYEHAASGGKSIEVFAGQTVTGEYEKKFGHVLPDWRFDIVQQPSPGEYRYLEFTWKAKSNDTTGMMLRVSPNWFNGVGVVAGKVGPASGARLNTADAPPEQWQTMVIDLYKARGKPFPVRNLTLVAEGGSALIDHIRLHRTRETLPEDAMRLPAPD